MPRLDSYTVGPEQMGGFSGSGASRFKGATTEGTMIPAQELADFFEALGERQRELARSNGETALHATTRPDTYRPHAQRWIAPTAHPQELIGPEIRRY